MDNLIINTGKFIISHSDDSITEFIESGVNNYFKELSKYIKDNNDPEIFHYATEMTMSSFFVCGNLRSDLSLTGLQEYGTICARDGKEVKGRPDIFIKSGLNAVWIECKYEKNIRRLEELHWDLPKWLLWDQENALAQVETYYKSEKATVNNSYNKHYLMTLCFKLIRENAYDHNKKVEISLAAKTNGNFNRIWYYQVGFMNDSAIRSLGIEVYGTCSQMELPTNSSHPKFSFENTEK